ncbi:MAG: precorrin-8X methylmutase [Rhodospirillaceae bacterium]|jgi:precorrin isomerase|nr:precorrin-8X methylmutase [Rhodospirillaceae bacterium]
MSYIKDPTEIYRVSFAAIRREVDLSPFPKQLHNLVLRMVHAVAQPEITENIAWRGDAATAALSAINEGAAILADANMVMAGIMKDRVTSDSPVICMLRDESVPALAQNLGTTRSAAAVELWRPHLAGAVVTIGNAPTALFHLLEMLTDRDCPRPAAILAFPVGFIGAAESKQALIDSNIDVPFVTLKGRQGGTPLAAAAVNSILLEGDA